MWKNLSCFQLLLTKSTKQTIVQIILLIKKICFVGKCICQEEWCGGSDTMEEIVSRIHQREEAAFKRERAMAYAFSHQVQNFNIFSFLRIVTSLGLLIKLYVWNICIISTEGFLLPTNYIFSMTLINFKFLSTNVCISIHDRRKGKKRTSLSHT